MSGSRLLAAVGIVAALLSGCGGEGATAPVATEPLRPALGAVEASGLHNAFRLTDKLYSGSSPDGDEGFRSLQKLGIKTIITVDGMKPDVERAHKFGMRYVHLPVGYDGISEEQGLKIAKAVRDLPGPIYLHCHHGQHRGPAAAAVARVCLDPCCGVEQAMAEMKRAGTDPHYTGLYAAPRQIGRPTKEELDRVPDDFPELSQVGGLADAMVGIDNHWDWLKQARAAGWKVPPDHPDTEPAHEALMLVEAYKEVARLPDMKKRPEELRRWLAEVEVNMQDLEKALRQAPPAADAAETSFRKVSAACTRCHASYRDVPRKQ